MTENIKRVLESIRTFSPEKFEQSLNGLDLKVDVTENFISSFVQNLKGEYFLLPLQANVFIKYCDSLITKGYQVTKKDLEAIESLATDTNLLVKFIIKALQNYKEKTLPFFAHLSIFKLEEISQMSADSEVQDKNLFFNAVRISKFLKKLVHLFDIETSNEKLCGWQPRAVRELLQEYQTFLLSLDDNLVDKKIKSKLVENMTNNIPLLISEKENIEKALRNGESIGFCLALKTTSLVNHAIGIYSVGSYLIISNSGYTEESQPYIKFYKLSPEEKVQFFAKNILTQEMKSVIEFETCMHEVSNEPIVLECIEQESGTCSWRAMQNNLLVLWMIATLEQPNIDNQLTAQLLKETNKKANLIFDRLYDSFCLNALYEIIIVNKEAQSYLLKDPLAKEVLSECYDLCSKMKKNQSENRKFQELKRILGHGLMDYAGLFATDYLKPLLNKGALLFSADSREKNPASQTQSSTFSMK